MILRNIRRNKILSLVVSLSMISFIITLFAEGDFKVLAFLPLSYAFINIFFFNVYRKIGYSMVTLITIAGYTIKMSIVPAIIVLGNYNVLILTEGIMKNIVWGVIISIYEVIAIYGFLYYYLHKKKYRNSGISFNSAMSVDNSFFIAKTNYIILIILLLIIGFILLRFNVMMNYFSFFWETDISKILVRNSQFRSMKSQVPPIIYWMFIYAVELFKILIIGFSTVSAFRKRSVKSYLKTFLIFALLISISTPENAMVWFALGAFGLLLISRNEKLQKHLIKIAISAFMFIIIALIVKIELTGGDLFSSLSITLAAYFPATINLLYAFEIPTNPVYMVSDVLSTLPFIEYFFKNLNTGLEQVAIVVNNYGYYGNDQLTPTISQGVIYFSPVFAPILTLISIKVATIMEIKAYNTNNIFEKYLLTFLTVITAISYIMYNFSTMTKFLAYYGPLFALMIMVNRRIRIR